MPADRADWLPPADALRRIVDGVRPIGVEARPLLEALGHVLAEEVASPVELPPWDNSAMDGYAIRSADVAAAADEAPVRLEVIGEVRAGQAPETTVRRGTAVRIATGAPVPPGADAVVPVEATTPVDAAGAPAGPRGREATGPLPAGCLVHEAVPIGGSIRRAGSDLAAGTLVVPAGSTLTPAAIALVAGTGHGALPVRRRVRVGVMATGDEIREPGQSLGPAGIPNANGPALVALIEAAGAEAHVLGIAADRFDDVRARLCAGLVEGLDAIIVSGGVSVGPYDVVRSGFAEFGTIELWRVAVQPGKPFVFGTARAPGDDGADPSRPATLLFGLPAVATIRRAPRRRASGTAKLPTPPAAPATNSVLAAPTRSLRSARLAVMPATGTAAASS